VTKPHSFFFFFLSSGSIKVLQNIFHGKTILAKSSFFSLSRSVFLCPLFVTHKTASPFRFSYKIWVDPTFPAPDAPIADLEETGQNCGKRHQGFTFVTKSLSAVIKRD